MKKLIKKDKKIRNRVKSNEKTKFILKSILLNNNYLKLTRWNTYHKFNGFTKNNSEVSVVNRCRETVHKKRLNKFSYYSRHVYLRLIRFGKITGIQKSTK